MDRRERISRGTGRGCAVAGVIPRARARFSLDTAMKAISVFRIRASFDANRACARRRARVRMAQLGLMDYRAPGIVLDQNKNPHRIEVTAPRDWHPPGLCPILVHTDTPTGEVARSTL